MKPRVLDRINNAIKAKDGKLISIEVIKWKTRVTVECKAGHQFKVFHYSLYRNWCPHCAGRTPLTIEDAHKVAKEKGGTCLSTQSDFTQGQNSKLLWRCHANHEWYASIASVKKTSWCPTCRGSSYGEKLVRHHFEHYTGLKFPNTRPTWLRIPGGKRAHELDGYNSNLKIAFEVHGRQHYQPVAWDKNDDGVNRFNEQIIKDKQKLAVCAANGVNVLVIPEVPTLTLETDLNHLIVNFLKDNNIELVTEIPPPKIDLSTIKEHNSMLIRYRQLAISKGGKCLSPNYTISSKKAKWSCKDDHIFKMTWNDVQQGKWCAKCAGIKPLTIQDLHDTAATRGGKCLSVNYTRANDKYDWECAVGHKWSAKAGNVRHGQWCPTCAVSTRASKKRKLPLPNA